jgi:hypothetical protein
VNEQTGMYYAVQASQSVPSLVSCDVPSVLARICAFTLLVVLGFGARAVTPCHLKFGHEVVSILGFVFGDARELTTPILNSIVP